MLAGCSGEHDFCNACQEHSFAGDSHNYCAEPRRGKTIQDPLTVHIDQVLIAFLQCFGGGFHLFLHPGVKESLKIEGAKDTFGIDILGENRLVHVLYL